MDDRELRLECVRLLIEAPGPGSMTVDQMGATVDAMAAIVKKGERPIAQARIDYGAIGGAIVMQTV